MEKRAANLLEIPSSLLAQIQAAAEEEHRPMAEVLSEAVERYLHQRRWQKLFAYGEQRALDLGLTEDDIPNLIAEYRRDRGSVEK